MKRFLSVFLTVIISAMCVSCASPAEEETLNMEPEVSQMKAICELAVMECYYHNVAKYYEEDASGVLWWKKDKQFWIEYSGVVKLGVDITSVNIEVNDTQVSITLPAAKVLGCKVDSASLTEDSFIVAKNSADVDASDEVKAFDEAQSKLQENAASDTALLASAQQQAQDLLEDYITNIGNAVGKEYTIKWIYTDATDNPLEATTTEASTTENRDE